MSLNIHYMPKLRPVEPVGLVVEGREAIGLTDPLRISDQTVCVDRSVLPLLTMLDGRHSIVDIQAELTRMTGRIVFSDDILSLVNMLDEAFLLEGERFQQAFDDKVRQFRNRPYRPSSHAGTSYPAETEALRSQLDRFFVEDGGPGTLQYFVDDRRPKGLIAPHIDVRSGGKCFAHAYHTLAAGTPSDLYIIFGTGHAGVKRLFTATNLDFQTPLGTVETDRDFVHRLGEELGEDPAAEEILHATEHVIEFQVIFLQHLFAGRHQFKIVPILASLAPQFLDPNAGFHEELERFDRFCGAVREVVRTTPGRVCYIASADLDHIGPRYGDSFMPDDNTVTRALEGDRKLLATVEKLDMEAFVREVTADNDSRRVCGFSPIAAMLACMDASVGELLALEYTRVDNRNSFVSFASMIFR